ncbi:hypothetical protein ACFL1H_06580 [Nanoarchaeota archaeon]
MEERFGPIGTIVENLYQFIRSDYDPTIIVRDQENETDIQAMEYFIEQGNRYIIRNEKLPLDPDIKGGLIYKAGKNSQMPVLELSFIKFVNNDNNASVDEILEDKFSDSITREYKPNRFGKSFFTLDGTKLVETKVKNGKVNGKMTKRSLAFFVHNYDEELCKLSYNLLDEIFYWGAMKRDENLQEKIDEIEHGGAVPQGPPSLKQVLSMEQRQELAGVTRGEQILSTNLNIGFAIRQSQVYKKSVEELKQEAHEINNGLELALLKPMRREIIENIKKAFPGISDNGAKIKLREFEEKQLSYFSEGKNFKKAK